MKNYPFMKQFPVGYLRHQNECLQKLIHSKGQLRLLTAKIHVGIRVDKMALRQVFLRVALFFLCEL